MEEAVDLVVVEFVEVVAVEVMLLTTSLEVRTSLSVGELVVHPSLREKEKASVGQMV